MDSHLETKNVKMSRRQSISGLACGILMYLSTYRNVQIIHVTRYSWCFIYSYRSMFKDRSESEAILFSPLPPFGFYPDNSHVCESCREDGSNF